MQGTPIRTDTDIERPAPFRTLYLRHAGLLARRLRTDERKMEHGRRRKHSEGVSRRTARVCILPTWGNGGDTEGTG